MEATEGDVLALDLSNGRDDGVWSEPRNVDCHCIQAKFSKQINKFIRLVGMHPGKKTQEDRLQVFLEIRPGIHDQQTFFNIEREEPHSSTLRTTDCNNSIPQESFTFDGIKRC